MFYPATQEQLDAVLRGGLSLEEASNPALLNAAKKNKQWADNTTSPDRGAQNNSAPGGFRSQPFATGATPMLNHGASGAYHAAMGSAQQGKALGDMISQTMSAHQDENDSRVAQLREIRRMEHEKDLKRMELDAMLARLAQAQQPTGPQPKAVFRGGAIY
jgi:hypothetical protein